MTRILCAILLLAACSTTRAGVEEDWKAIVALDAGPKKQPTTRAEAQLLARNFLGIQQKALENFLSKYPSDPHAFEARQRLASIWAAEGMLDANPALTDKAMATLAELEKTPGASDEQRATAGFLRISLFLQNQKGDPDQVRDAIILASRKYDAQYPGDRRGPRLLVEAATLCDDTPTLKRELLNQALAETHEDALKQRINDDLKRIAFLGQPLAMKFTSLQGKEIDLEALHGQVVILIFWAADSPHSLLWLREFREAYEKWRRAGVTVITISLDQSRKALDERLRDLPASWPTYFDGKGWTGPFPRSLGINALPSVWILDKKGIVRTINAKLNYETWVKQLSQE